MRELITNLPISPETGKIIQPKVNEEAKCALSTLETSTGQEIKVVQSSEFKERIRFSDEVSQSIICERCSAFIMTNSEVITELNDTLDALCTER